MPQKIIRSPSDLAINGAPPAFDEPLHVGRPNIGDREAFLQRVNQILDIQRLSNNDPVVQQLESHGTEFFAATQRRQSATSAVRQFPIFHRGSARQATA